MLTDRSIKINSQSLVLFISDALCIFASLLLAASFRMNFSLSQGLDYIQQHIPSLTGSAVIFLLVFYISGLYERSSLVYKRNSFAPIALSVLIALIVIIVTFYARYALGIGRGILLLAAVFVFLSTYAVRRLYASAVGRGLFNRNALIVGGGREARSILSLIRGTPGAGYTVYGVVASSKARPGDFIEGIPILGGVDKLREFASAYAIDTILVATSLSREHALLKILRPLRYAGMEIKDYASLYEELAQEIPLDHIDDEWLMHAAMNSSRIHIRKIKRVLDVAAACIGLILSAPISLVAAVAIRLDSPGPIFYRQRRAGLDGQPYTLFKFRSMRADAEQQTGAIWAGKFDARVTRVGAFLRKSRIDEIPQLINILKGDMSLVGPRPERPEFIDTLTDAIPFYKERLLVLPGLTGWAQVKYPYTASVEAGRRKLQFDLYYIKHMSLFLDVVIMLRTLKTIVIGLRHSEDFEAQSAQDVAPQALQVLSIPPGPAAGETRSA